MLNSPENRNSSRAGFTLVELMVSIGLLVLIMSIFAQIFSLAVGVIVTQRGISQNNQKARTLFTIASGSNTAKGDLKHISYGTIDGEGGIAPMSFGVDPNENQKGYLYISENDPDNQTDDRIQFTAEIPLAEEGQKQEYFYGKAVSLNNISADKNQPVWDNGISSDSSSRSRKAEIAYFMRNGILYRRVLLIREEDELRDVTGADIEPTHSGGPFLSTYTGDFYKDFDFSAYHNGFAKIYTSVDSNSSFAKPLGNSIYRFGFNHATGLPREYLDKTNSEEYIGCFTHEETSNTGFGYPSILTGSIGDPYDQSTTPSYNATDGVVSLLEGGSRKGEDILLVNVLEFDVKVWDAGADSGNGAFIDIGDNSLDGDNLIAVDFAASNNQNSAYGSDGPSENNVFDTWHSQMSYGTKIAPYRRLEADAGAGAKIWIANQIVLVGEIYIPSPAFYSNPPIDSSSQKVIAFRAITVPNPGVTTTGALPTDEPSWPSVTQYNPGMPATVTGSTGIEWQAIYNVRPLRAIQLRIVFKDPGTGQIRQVTIVHTFK